MALEPVMISALNQYVFCPRRCALMHVEGIWSDNEHTTIGALLHDHTDEPGYETDGAVTLLRALPLYSAHYGLVGKADIVEMRAGIPAPVEYKKGSAGNSRTMTFNFVHKRCVWRRCSAWL